jgi:hypothetical protein
MDYLTNFYKNRCEQLQEQVNRLSKNIKLLTEMEAPEAPDPTRLDAANVGGYVGGSANQRVTNDPTQWTSDQPPPNADEWFQQNPPPNPRNYPRGIDDPRYQQHLKEWNDRLKQAIKKHNKWKEKIVDRDRKYGDGDYEWSEIPNFGLDQYSPVPERDIYPGNEFRYPPTENPAEEDFSDYWRRWNRSRNK